jgi:hypothetical protein
MNDKLEIIRNALYDMATWNSVAEELMTRGIRGSNKSGDACPVAVYLRGLTLSRCPNLMLVVTNKTVVFKANKYHRMSILTLPANVTNFIREFDNGKYPALMLAKSEDESL